MPDLDGLDREALKALLIKHQEELLSLAASHENELRSLETELEYHRQTLSQQDEELRSSSEQIEHLQLLIEKLRRRVFGIKSEKVVIQLEQLELHLEELETSQAESEAAVERVRPAAEPKTRSRRKPLPEHLPREVVSHTFPSDSCPDCGGQLRQFGEDVSEQLEYIPDSFKVIRHVRPKFACSGCERVVEVPAPSRPIERGLAGPGLLAHVLVSKFADHLPLYRQSERRASLGSLGRSTYVRRRLRCTNRLAPTSMASLGSKSKSPLCGFVCDIGRRPRASCKSRGDSSIQYFGVSSGPQRNYG
jgi:transposase